MANMCMPDQCFTNFVVMNTTNNKKFPTYLTYFLFNLNEQPHFLVPMLLQINLSLYCLYVLPFSQPTTTLLPFSFITHPTTSQTLLFFSHLPHTTQRGNFFNTTESCFRYVFFTQQRHDFIFFIF